MVKQVALYFSKQAQTHNLILWFSSKKVFQRQNNNLNQGENKSFKNGVKAPQNKAWQLKYKQSTLCQKKKKNKQEL